jgi:hypothetical protein
MFGQHPLQKSNRHRLLGTGAKEVTEDSHDLRRSLMPPMTIRPEQFTTVAGLRFRGPLLEKRFHSRGSHQPVGQSERREAAGGAETSHAKKPRHPNRPGSSLFDHIARVGAVAVQYPVRAYRASRRWLDRLVPLFLDVLCGCYSDVKAVLNLSTEEKSSDFASYFSPSNEQDLDLSH